MSQTTTPPAPVVPIRPTAAVAPQSWPAGPYPACPPDAFSAMARLVSCYEDVRLATEFLSKVMTDLITNNADVRAAIVAAIEASGSNLPLIGVTNGQPAQPGQVGEFVQLGATWNYPGTGISTTMVNFGTLQPGDWDCWMYATTNTPVSGEAFALSPQPPGFSNPLYSISSNMMDATTALMSSIVQGLISVPTPIVASVSVNSAVAGSMGMTFAARRMR